MEKLVAILLEKNITIGSVESLTGGLFGTNLTSFSKISKVYRGSLITYATSLKAKLLDLDLDYLNQIGVVSSTCARLMCLKGSQILDTDICVSFTGNAGPDVLEGKPKGLAYIGIKIFDDISVFEVCFPNCSRAEVRQKCVEKACQILVEKLEGE